MLCATSLLYQLICQLNSQRYKEARSKLSNKVLVCNHFGKHHSAAVLNVSLPVDQIKTIEHNQAVLWPLLLIIKLFHLPIKSQV